jgi:alpha/beta superfamily hydrolase
MTASADKSLFTGTNPITPGNRPALRSFFLDGPAGRLEALLNEGLADAPFAALVCHPHPLGGGTMHNKVVYHAAKVFSGMGWPVLRFNFRGTGLSQGEHDGVAEAEDVRAALDWLAGTFARPIVAAGFSFGAAMGLRACSTRTDVQGFAALGLPTHAEGRDYHYPFWPRCEFPNFSSVVMLTSMRRSASCALLLHLPGNLSCLCRFMAPLIFSRATCRRCRPRWAVGSTPAT